MKKLLRKWARWFFEKQIRVYQINTLISADEMMQIRSEEHLNHIKWEMVRKLAEKMFADGLIEIEQHDIPYNMNTEIRAKVRII